MEKSMIERLGKGLQQEFKPPELLSIPLRRALEALANLPPEREEECPANTPPDTKAPAVTKSK